MNKENESPEMNDDTQKVEASAVKRLVSCKKGPGDTELVCPDCGYYPMTLMGERKGLTLKMVGRKAQCPRCPFEEDF